MGWNSTLKTRTPMKRTAMRPSTRRMNKVGRRAEDWRKAWRFLKPRLEAAGRVQCEFTSVVPHECSGPLDPCHSKKRRLMQGPDIYSVAIGCRTVHVLLDYYMSHEDMESAVMRAIDDAGGLILPERY